MSICEELLKDTLQSFDASNGNKNMLDLIDSFLKEHIKYRSDFLKIMKYSYCQGFLLGLGYECENKTDFSHDLPGEVLMLSDTYVAEMYACGAKDGAETKIKNQPFLEPEKMVDEINIPFLLAQFNEEIPTFITDAEIDNIDGAI